SIRSAFAFSACARATLALTRTRLVNRIRSRAARHRGFRIENLAAIDPNLHTDLPKRRPRFGKTVIDVGTERVQRQLSLQVPLAASDFSAVQTPTDLDLDPLRAKPQRLLDGLSHRTSKSDALLELCRNLLGLQLCVQLGFVDLLNRNQHFPSRLRRKVGLQLVDLSALAADDDSRARGVDDDLQAIGGSLDIHVRHTGAGETLLEIAFELQVLEQKLAKLLLRKPVRMPVFVIAESKTVWMNFLTHNLLQFFVPFAAPDVPFLRLLFGLGLVCLGLLLRSLLCSRLLSGCCFRFRCRSLRPRSRCRATTLTALALRQLCRLCLSAGLSAVCRRSLVIAQGDRDVTEVSLLSIRAALRRRPHAPAVLCRSAIDERRPHPEIIRVDRDICFLSRLVRIRDCRTHALLDVGSRAFLRKPQDSQRPVDVFAANHIHDQPRLLRRPSQILRTRCCFHQCPLIRINPWLTSPAAQRRLCSSSQPWCLS